MNKIIKKLKGLFEENAVIKIKFTEPGKYGYKLIKINLDGRVSIDQIDTAVSCLKESLKTNET